MTIQSVSIALQDVSARIQRIDAWRKATEGIGRFELLLDNHDGLFDAAFSADAAVSINVGTTGQVFSFFKGYVDVGEHIYTQNESAKLIRQLKVSGRDYGQDEQNKTVYAVSADAAGKIVHNLFYGTPPNVPYTEITYTDPGGTPNIFFDSKGRTLLSDCLREILQNINYDGYVDSNKVWQMFPVGTLSSQIHLYNYPEDARNNIIGPINHVPVDATELRNVVMAYGKNRVIDAWTDVGDAANWLALFYCTLSDYLGVTPVPPCAGASAIKVTNTSTTAAAPTWALIFPKFNYWYLDWSNVNLDSIKISLYVVANQYYSTLREPCIRLTDTNGHVIKYTFGGTYETDKWLTFEVPIGTNITTEAKIKTEQLLWFWEQPYDAWFWNIYGGDTDFNWKVVSIAIDSPYLAGSTKLIEYILFDNMCLPAQIYAISDQSVGSPYKVRQLKVNRPDITYQADLQAFANSVCNKRKDPLEVLSLRAAGSAGLVNNVWKWLPGYAIALNDVEAYRMVSIHDIVERNVDNSGFNHVTDLSLVPKFAELDTLRWSYSQQGDVGITRQLHDRIRALEATNVIES